MPKRKDRHGHQRPLYVKISLLHCLIICGVVALLVFTISHIASGILLEQNTEKCSKDLFAISQKMDMLFDGYERDCKAIIKNQQYQSAMSLEEGANRNENALRSLKIAIALADFRSAYTRIQRIRFYDVADHTVIDDYLDSTGPKASSSWETVETFIAAQQTLDWTDFSVRSGAAQVSLMHLVNNYSGRFIGVLELTVGEEQVNGLYRNFESEDLRFYLISGQGEILSCSDKARLGQKLAEEAALTDVLQAGEAGANLRMEKDEYIVVSVPYEKFNCWLVGLASKRAIVKDVNLLVWTIIFIGALGILTASVLVRWTSKKSTYPLERILRVIDSVSHGQYDARVDLHAGEEFHELGMQLNEMIDNMVGMMELIRCQSEQKRMYELQNLQMQMNPHFLYNSLETVCGIIESGDDKLAIRMINDISRFYRGVLSGGSSMVTVGQELQITRKYLEIIQIRYRDSFDFSCDIQPELLQMAIPKLILQPLVENAVIHGFIGKRAHAQLRIEGRMENGRGVIAISDDGCGIVPELVEKLAAGDYPQSRQGSGFGLRSIDERIKLTFGKDYGLRIWSEYGVGTRVSLVFPLQEQEGQA
ncbi:MAG: sensor histidine kinase [Aristaeellaceae bacterium]